MGAPTHTHRYSKRNQHGIELTANMDKYGCVIVISRVWPRCAIYQQYTANMVVQCFVFNRVWPVRGISNGFPRTCLIFSNGFPMGFQGFSRTFPGLFNGFLVGFPKSFPVFRAFAILFQGFLKDFPKFFPRVFFSNGFSNGFFQWFLQPRPSVPKTWGL